MKLRHLPPFVTMTIGLLALALRADVSLPRIFGDNLVLQRGGPVDDVSNVHPAHKREVGERLAALALAESYGRTGSAWEGPAFAKLALNGAVAVVRFTHAGGGLVSHDDRPLTDFEIAGAGGAFVPAAAIIRGDTVVVSSPQVAAPVAVRFGWSETARPNLMNRAGLPAYPFRSSAPVWSNDP